MVTFRDPRSNSNIGVEQINSTLLDRATDLLGYINGAIGFKGTGAKNFTIIENGALSSNAFAVHTIEANSDEPKWVEAQNVIFQAAPYRLNQIKSKLEANIDAIKNDIASNIENLFSMIGSKNSEFDPLENSVSNALNIDDVLLSGKNLENSLLDFDKLAKDIAEMYFSSQFSLGGLDLRIEEEIFGLLGKPGEEYSNGTTDKPKYLFSFLKRNINQDDIYERFSNEIKTDYENIHGSNSWNKENYLQEMFENKQLRLSSETLNAIVLDKNRKKNEFNSEAEVLALVDNFDDLIRIISAEENNRADYIEKLFKEHLSKYTPPAQLIDVSDEESFLELGIKQFETFSRDSYGDSTWEADLENYSLGTKNVNINFNLLNQSLTNLISSAKLKLDPELIETIIKEKELNEENLKGFKSSADFLKILDTEELFTIAGKHYGLEGNQKATQLKLFEHNLKINTPIYYEDQRSVYDILSGKNNNNGDKNNINRLFSSLEKQIKGLGETTKNLINQGYDKAPKNNLQQYLRNNPLETAYYLENYLSANEANLNDSEKTSIINQIKKMMDRFELSIGEQMNKSNIEYKDSIIELQRAVSGYDSSENKNISAIKQKFETLNSSLKNKFNFEPWPDNLKEFTAENYSSIISEIDEDPKFYKTHQALYAMEMQEASKLNSQHFNKKLPEPRPDGTIPESNDPIAPTIGPTLLSSVIAGIGNQAIERANSIIQGDHPDTKWLSEQSSFLKKLDDNLQTLPTDTTRSKQFIEAMKSAFIPIIKKFLENKSESKIAADNAKNDLVTNNINLKKLNIINGTDSGFSFGTGDLDSDLNQIEVDLASLMNPETININSNKISKFGLENTKKFLEDSAKNLQEMILNPPEGGDLEDLQNKLSKVYDLLFGDFGNTGNPASGSIVERFTTFNNDIDSACLNKPDDIDRQNYLTNKQNELINNYKTAIINFSNNITSIEDTNNFDIKQAFKDALDKASSDFDGDGDLDPALDSDGNGINDFEDLKNLANKISGGADSLAGTLENVFGSKNETGKDIKNMGIRRLILMMFIFTLFESGDWDYQRQESDTSRYQVW